MKKMIFSAAFAIMMAMGNMNAFANKNGAKHNDVNMNGKNRVEVRYDAHHDKVAGHRDHKMSKHEQKMMEKRRREEERRRMEEARRREEMRRMEAHHHHDAVASNVAAGVVASISLAALISALAQ